MLTEEQIADFLKMEGARRAATGVIIPFGDDGFLHIQDARPNVPGLTTEEHEFESFCSVKEVLRLRELKIPHDYLLRLRAMAVIDSPRQRRVMAKRRRDVEARGKAWSLSSYYEQLDRSAKSYVSRLSRQSQRRVRGVPVGLAPIREANAVCMRTLVGDIVLASEAMRHFYYFMVIATQGGAYDVNPVDRADAALIALRLMIGSETLDFDLDPRAVLDRKLEALVRGQVDWLMEFTFGHEYGHLLLGHLANSDDVGVDAPKTYAHDMEFAADLHAVQAVTDRAAAREMACAGYNLFLFLHFIELVAETRPEVPRFSVSATHPSPLDRLRRLRGSMPDKGQPETTYLGGCIREIRRLRDYTLQRIEAAPRDDLLTFSGSIHLAGLNGRPGRDRIDY